MNSRAKGCRGELEWAEFLRGLGCQAHRGRQYDGRLGAPDVTGGFPNTHVEVKRCEKLNVEKALQQAERDARGVYTPYLAHRRNRSAWTVSVRAADLPAFARSVLAVVEPDRERF